MRFAPGLLGLLSYLGQPASDLKSREILPFTRPTHPTLAQSAPFTVRFAPGLLGLLSYLCRPASDLRSREISPTLEGAGRKVEPNEVIL